MTDKNKGTKVTTEQEEPMAEEVKTDETEVKESKKSGRKWSGLPTPDGTFLCYVSSIANKKDAEATATMLCDQGKEAWFEYNKETKKYVVKYAK